MQSGSETELQYGRKKKSTDAKKSVALELEAALANEKDNSSSSVFELLRLSIVLAVRLLNPFNWHRAVFAIRLTWLKSTQRYDKALNVLNKIEFEKPRARVFVALEKVDCLIQLRRLTEARNALKGLAEEVEACDEGADWKGERKAKIQFYRETIYHLASVPKRNIL